MIDISDDGDLQSLDRLFVTQHRVSVEQCLRGMFVHAIPGIEDWDIEMGCHQQRSTGVRMPDDDEISTNGAEGVGSVEQRLALFYT